MSTEEASSRMVDTQETYYEDSNQDSKVISEMENASLHESQDFHLIDTGGDESMVETTKQTQYGEANSQKSLDQINSQQILEAARLEVDNNAITANDKEDNIIMSEKIIEGKIEKTEGNGVFDELGESLKKNELFDEDEIIQGTPPRSYSPSRKLGNVDGTNLKRKASIVDELPAKIPRTTSTEDITKQVEEEESQQSYESDDSYQDLLKNVNRNIVIEETQDPTNLEFTQNSQKISAEYATKTTDDKAHEHEHTKQQRNENFSEKCCDMEKDENLNVSAKLTDTSTNDSTVVIMNSTNENDSFQLEDNLSVEMQKDVASTSIVVANEKSGIGTLDERKFITGKVLDENNQVEQSNNIEPAGKTVDDNDEEIPSSQTKSRISVELIYEGANRIINDEESRSKPQIVQIDDDGEKIVLDASTEIIYDVQDVKTRPEIVQIDDSHENDNKIVLDSGKNSEIRPMEKYSSESKSCTDFSYKSAESMKESSLDSKLTADNKRHVNGNTESKKSDTDMTLSLDSDICSGCDEHISSALYDVKKMDSARSNAFVSKDMDNIELISLSDNETSNVEEKNKSDLIYNSTAKTVKVEREIGIYLKLQCLVHVDESTKEPISKELTAVQYEPVIIESMGRQKNEDSQSSPVLADISDNKDSSPGSINSNPQLYQLNPLRYSIMSVSSSSSASSAASLANKLSKKNNVHFFTVPMGPAKHAKKSSQEGATAVDKQALDETYDRLTREWKNHRLLTSTILNYANAELSGIATTNVATTVATVDTFANVSNERLDDDDDHHHHHHLGKTIRSSTPSDQPMTNLKVELTATPKSTKKIKVVERPRSKLARSNAQINSENGTDDIPNEPTPSTSVVEMNTPTSRKKIKTERIENKLLTSDMDISTNSSPRNILSDQLIGKSVFAKWSDNIYYPGKVIDQMKTKYKIKFYDGKTKTLIPEFVIPIPKILREGLSVYATTKTDDYNSCFIVGVHTSDNDDNTYYTVETDLEHERLHVQLQNISLSVDQAQVLKEEVAISNGSLPSTPKALSQVTLDNMVDGKRRSKRIGTPLFSTPKSKSNQTGASTPTGKTKSKAKPSVSGMPAKLKRDTLSDEGISSDSNVELVQDEYLLRGVQREIISMPYEQNVKGPQNRIKSKPRSKKKMEDPQTIKFLGPIPTNSNIFKGMSFILTCVSSNTTKLDRHLDRNTSDREMDATDTDFETENEDDWEDRPFLRDRLHEQILAGGGQIYKEFENIPKDEYKNTILITNVPNTTINSILCLSVGIRVCNHKWIIRCCAEEKIVSVADYALPKGWSLHKKTYIEAFQTDENKPLSKIVVIIPNLISDIKLGQFFVTFWRQVCENAGAIVLIVEDSGAMETIDFDSNGVVISNQKCPLWAIDKAARLKIPVLSTTWVIQCIIEGKLCPQDQHPRYKYNFITN